MPRYRAATDMLRIGASPKEACFGYARWTRSAHMLDADDWKILQRAITPATLEEHARRIAGAARMSAPVVLERLAKLEAAGLLIDTDALTDVRATDIRPPTVMRVGIPTRNRPDKLRACITSWAEMAARHERELEVVIADDGRDDEECGPVVEVLEELSRSGVNVAYAGPAERLRYADALSEAAGVEPELVRWLLHFAPPEISGEGTVRNALLLDSVGAPFVFVDDDTLCRLAPPPNVHAGLAIHAQNPHFAWFPNPDGSAKDLVTFEDLDVFGVVETALGRDIAAWVAESETTFDGAPSQLCRSLHERGGRIAALQVGIAGDVATGSVAHYLTLSGPARQQLHRSQRVYEHAIRSRQGVVSAPRWTIADVDHCMTYFLALDARMMLPPFMPMGRNTDGLFGTILHRTTRDAYMAFAPWVVEHDATPRPSSRQLMIDTATDVYGNDLLIRFARGAARTPASADIGASIAAFGHVMQHAASFEGRDFDELVRTAMARTRAGDLALLRRALGFFKGQPEYWAADARAVADNLRHVLAQPAVGHPHDMTRLYGADRALEELRVRADRYGAALIAWPALWQAARALAERGVRLAEPITN